MQHHNHPYVIALKSIDGIGNQTILKLLGHFQKPAEIFKATSAQLSEAGIHRKFHRLIQNFDFTQISAILDWLTADDHHLITIDHPCYPENLKHIHAPPAALFAAGNIQLLANPQVAVVGTRNPTPQGLATTIDIVKSLVESGITITSGLALGIDGQAHRAALEDGGQTIAVCGTGLNRVYPAQHRELAYEIKRCGLLVSEYLPNARFHAGSFPQRNRIIAGLSQGTLVIQAKRKSGSLITAQQAMEAGREVFAVPGSIHCPQAKGCHWLIQQGAKLIESVDDILSELSLTRRPTQPASNARSVQSNQSLDESSKALLECIDFETTPLDTIISRSQLTVEAVTNKLLLLELKGWVINSTGGYIRQSPFS